MAIQSYTTVAASNTSIEGINIAEGCAPSGINNAIRQLMADIKGANYGTSGTLAIADANFSITGSSDVTKVAKFEVDGLTTATTRTFTLPDVTDTIVTLTATQTLTNKTLTGPTINTPTLTVTDSGLSITGSSDATKILKFEVDGFTGSTTRTITIPDSTGEMCLIAATQNLTNKTLTAPAINGTVTTSGLTMPAFTLGGTVTLNGQSFSGTCANGGTFTTIDINGGTVDGTAIGGSSASTGAFTTISASSTSQITGAATFGTNSSGNSAILIQPVGNVNKALSMKLNGDTSSQLQAISWENNGGTTVANIWKTGDSATSAPFRIKSCGTVEFHAQDVGISGATAELVVDTTFVYPGSDNTLSCGKSGNRWSELFSANGTINTSDARTKTEVAPFTAAELAAAKDLAREIGTFQFLDAVAKKGDAARHHIGMTVQRAMQIMENHGLDPMRYGFICFDKWEEERNDFDVVTTEAGEMYGFRMDQLLAFIARGFEARLTALENAQ